MSPGMPSGQSKARSTKLTPDKGPKSMLMMAESPASGRGSMRRQRETNELGESMFQVPFSALSLHLPSNILLVLRSFPLLEYLVHRSSLPLYFFLLSLSLAFYFRHAMLSHPSHIAPLSFCFLSLSSFHVAPSSL